LLNYQTIFSEPESNLISIDTRERNTVNECVTDRYNIGNKPKTSQPGARVRIAASQDEFAVTGTMFNNDRENMFSAPIDELDEQQSPIY